MIALKASQTIFPLTRDFCFVLTNLEYARDPSTEPLAKRTFAHNFRSSMTRADALIRTRKLSAQEVARVNFIVKARARRSIAASRKEWLYPEEMVSDRVSCVKRFCRPKTGFRTLVARYMCATRMAVSTTKTSSAGPKKSGTSWRKSHRPHRRSLGIHAAADRESAL
jgi:hypothetical protein